MKKIFLDTETTDFEGSIIELAYIVEGSSIKTYQSYSRANNISFGAMATHGITPEMVKDKPITTETEAYKALLELNNSNNYLVAHNLPFDLRMLEKEGFINRFKLIDTLRVAKHVLIEEEKKSLQYLRYSLGLYKREDIVFKELKQEKIAHSALPDCVWLKMLFDYFIKEKNLSYDDMVALTKKIPLEKIWLFGKYRGLEVEDIAKKDKQYLRWALNNMQNLSEEFKYTIKYWIN